MKSLVRVVSALLSAVMVIGPGVTYAAGEKKAEKAKKTITYDEHIKPILQAKCLGCHNPSKKLGGLDMTSYGAMRVGGSSGEVVELGDPDSSYLWLLVNHEAEPFMPPKSDKLEKPVLDLIGAWIEGGALENSGSKFVREKPKFDFSLKEVPTGKPEVPPVPGRLGLQPVIKTELMTAISALATNPWSPLAAVAGQQQVFLYDTQSLQLKGVLPFPEGIPHVLKFSRNGSLLLAAGGRGAYQGLVVVFDVNSGKRLFVVGNETDTVLGADISADQSLVALGSSGKTVRVYSVPDGELVYEIPKKHTDWIYCAAFSPDGVLLATADRAGGLFVWEAETGRPYLTLRAHSGAVNGLSWRGDSNVLASCGKDSRIRLWEMENGGQVKNWGAHGGGTESVEFTRSGQLVSCGRDKGIKLWDQNGKQQRAFSTFGDLALQVTYCDETNRVIAGDWTGQIRVWDGKNGDQLGELAANPPMLEDRLAGAEKLLAARKSEFDKLKLADQNAQAAAEKLESDLQATKRTVAELQKKVQTLNATIKQQQQSVAQLTAAVTVAEEQTANLKQVMPLLKQTATTAQQTSDVAPSDKQLVEVAAQLKALLQQRAAALATAQKAVSDKKPQRDKSKLQLAQAQKQVAEGSRALTDGQKRVNGLTDVAKAAQVKAASASKVAASAAQAFAEAQKQVDRWKVEIEVIQKIGVIKAQEERHDEQLVIVRQVEVNANQVRSQLSAAQQTRDNTRKQATQSANAVKKAEEKVKATGDAQSILVRRVSALEQALPVLRAASSKLGEAVKKAGQDKQLASVAAELKVVVEKKTGELDASKVAVVQKTLDVKKAQGELADTEKRSSKAAQDLVAAERVVTEVTGMSKQLEGQLEAARQVAAEVVKSVADLQQELDNL